MTLNCHIQQSETEFAYTESDSGLSSSIYIDTAHKLIVWWWYADSALF